MNLRNVENIQLVFHVGTIIARSICRRMEHRIERLLEQFCLRKGGGGTRDTMRYLIIISEEVLTLKQ